MTMAAEVDRFLAEENTAWCNLSPSDYDRAACSVLDRAANSGERRLDALLGVASAILGRENNSLTESRFCVAERLLEVVSNGAPSEMLGRVRDLFLVAWERLCASAAGGPESIAMTPELPAGSGVPYGADPSAIADSSLREQARAEVARHAAAVRRWNSKQRATDDLQRLAAQLIDAREQESSGLIAEILHRRKGPATVLRLLETPR